MKKFRVLAAIFVVIAMMTTVSFAEDIENAIVFEGDTVDFEGATGDTVEIKIYSGVEIVTPGSSYFAVKYDKTAWSYSKATDIVFNEAVLTDAPEDASGSSSAERQICVSTGTDDVTIPANTLIATMTFTATKDDVDGTVFEIVHPDNAADGWGMAQAADTEWYYVMEDTITVNQVVIAPPADPTVDTNAAEAYTTVTGIDGTVYNNVWVGEYSATAEEGAALTSMTVTIDAKNAFNVADYKTVEGEATVEFSIALVGAPANITGTVEATAAWVN